MQGLWPLTPLGHINIQERRPFGLHYLVNPVLVSPFVFLHSVPVSNLEKDQGDIPHASKFISGLLEPFLFLYASWFGSAGSLASQSALAFIILVINLSAALCSCTSCTEWPVWF